ncbi:bifunctional diguanylate cyclase/phosphodiesterase [Saccharopolyspora rhizosphaerae]|uniref:Bifunctional diguanylate cyclase/phosphodiesterase n=1 Tax=Saccharopolyspora rhizosphaerae TaxID=2492662 RepID=A0A426JPD5_9PSEU|nr:bifunctional diguanylate cyclase/phosphodiesterase [Saccharopolyspora rhizosphaerae]RRO15078.1 bifunctional diguanylate cyclase/phosphodiesterase [Saccharopolyspora rhizosphaerae]
MSGTSAHVTTATGVLLDGNDSSTPYETGRGPRSSPARASGRDQLTGLPDGTAARDLLTELLEEAGSGIVAVLCCDLNRFSRVNHALGHEAGDELIVTLTRRLQSSVPAGCTVARLSGDKCLVVCPDVATVGGVEALTAQVSHLLNSTVHVQCGLEVRFTASIGAAASDSAPPGTSGDDLLRFADAALFEAKRGGPGQVRLADASLVHDANTHLHREAQLRKALGNDGLSLRYQPIVDGSGTVQFAEALVRWNHLGRELPPGEFLPTAEEGNLLHDLDRWVLRTALREAVTWPDHGRGPVSVTVNLAALRPDHPHFADEVTEIIDDSGIQPERVVLELVETTHTDLAPHTQAAMRALTERGVRFALDDFGVGYSSLIGFTTLPISLVKIDRTFVCEIGTDPSKRAVARAILDMSRSTGRRCIAEGVETSEQFRELRYLGVEAYQGWLFAPALTPPDLRALLLRSTGGRP